MAARHIAPNGRTQVSDAPLQAWLAEQTWSGFAKDLAASYTKWGGFTPKQHAAAVRMREKITARGQQQAPKAAPPEPGFYRLGEQFFRVQMNRQKTSRYAKVYDQDRRDWVYVGREPFRHLTPETHMTLEEAMEWGHQWGRCLVCNAELTDPKSVARGIGPVCAKRFA